MAGPVRTAAISMSGTSTSMPNTAEPSTFSGTSMRSSARPVSASSCGARSVGCCGTSSRAASAATVPKGSVRPEATWTTWLLRVVQVDGGTCQRRAAAVISISRAAAPVRRIRSWNDWMLSLLPVNMKLTRGLRKSGANGALSRRTVLQSAPSSSASSAGSVVEMPWPISACESIRVTSFSGPIRTHAVSATSPASSAGLPMPLRIAPAAGHEAESSRAPELPPRIWQEAAPRKSRAPRANLQSASLEVKASSRCATANAGSRYTEAQI